MPAQESKSRSLTKTIVYRITNIVADLVIVYALTRRVDVTVGVTIFTNMASTILYYLHERVWNRISWGKGKK
jgi:uncharacterized membrane protein